MFRTDVTHLSRLLLALGIVLPGSPAAAQGPPAQTRIEAQPVAPNDPTVQLDVSPRGGHAAVVVGKGSRVAVVVDGVEGPKFDEILSIGTHGGAGKVNFSPDGSRYVYVGRVGQERVLMIDGKEALRVPVATADIIGPSNFPGPAFTANSKHLFFVLYTHISSSSGQSYYQFVFDGQPGPHSNDLPAVTFSLTGDRYAYMLTNPLNRDQHALLVDNKPAGYPGPGLSLEFGGSRDFQFTADGAHLFVRAGVKGANAMAVLVDGRPFMKADGATVYTAPVGNGFATVVAQGPRNGPAAQFIDIAGHKVPGSEGYLIDSLLFSPDGKHWATRVTTLVNSQFVIADGKKGLEYQHVGEMLFTAAGTIVYAATNANKQFVIVGDQESDGYQSMAMFPTQVTGVTRPFAIAGSRVGFMAAANGGGFDRLVVVDGKVYTKRNAGELTFSADGAHFAFMFDGGYNLDGTDVPGPGLLTFRPAPVDQFAMPPGRFLFSPDGKHLVAFGRASTGAGIFVDGKFLLSGNGTPYSPTFTPDSRHLFWMERIPNDGHWAVFLDGKPVVTLDVNDRMVDVPGAWEMGADGTLSVVGPTAEGYQRIRIIPGSDSSIDTMLAKMGRAP
ncbi:MAG TPA: hypothetical protein VGP87_12105 [Gemmatimonadales bacterium]|nr:hypothetical protein [Gemmatimonadales bacterium]